MRSLPGLTVIIITPCLVRLWVSSSRLTAVHFELTLSISAAPCVPLHRRDASDLPSSHSLELVTAPALQAVAQDR